MRVSWPMHENNIVLLMAMHENMAFTQIALNGKRKLVLPYNFVVLSMIMVAKLGRRSGFTLL